jgi:polyhydroxybutyrate depolymerase
LRHRSSFVAAVVVLAVVSLGAACSSDSKPSAGTAAAAASSSSTAPACSRPHAAGQTTESFDFQGVNRTYELYVPATYDGSRPVPLVFDFHGYGSNAKQQMNYGNFKPLADRDNFLIVAPEGQGDGAAKHFSLTASGGLQNDVQMTQALLDRLETQFCVDAKRVYSTGMSDGGLMTSILACTASDRFAAFGAVAVIVYIPNTCMSGRPVAITAFSGTADPIVPFNGGKVNCCGGSQIGAAPDAMAGWATRNGCDPAFSDETLGSEVIKRTWHNCAAGTETVFYMIQGGGHTWPGASFATRLGLTTNQISASDTIWAFFQAHPLP